MNISNSPILVYRRGYEGMARKILQKILYTEIPTIHGRTRNTENVRRPKVDECIKLAQKANSDHERLDQIMKMDLQY